MFILDQQYRRTPDRLHRRCRKPQRPGCRVVPARRQFHDERRAAFRMRVNPNLTAMFLDDGIRHGQSEPSSLANILRGEEGIENLRLHFNGDAGAIVTDFQCDDLGLGIVPRADDERTPAVRREHCLLGIDDQVEQHLLDLMRIRKDLRQP